ncbi:MAG: cytochrome b/b6 domain-containing protein [Alphaproteobacteria bacterium]|nr:cytochrome b/b6 domain-containing protein [Alphaproteobacteria bacterium]MCD8520146.1 cytochrome b/b6 domain-containing protein [Alphaproteobacteria bacterium]MCD8571066.1 cytochrome b/b6 domain-containing protein [Alphaproteobacteria bacterium]
MIFNSKERYGFVSRGFHWIIALLILCLLTVGFWMDALPYSPLKGTVYGLHKSFGMTVLVLATLRVFWTVLTQKPKHLDTHAFWEVALAKFIHILLYVGMIGMPLSGWIMSSAGDHPVPFFGLFNVPDIVPKDESLFRLAKQIHGLTAYALLAAIGLHFAGAVKHHVIDRDETLRRMGGNLLVAVLGAILIAAPVAVMVKIELSEEHKQEISTDEAMSAPLVNETGQATSQAEMEEDSGASSWAINHEDSRIGVEFMQYGQAVTGTFDGFDGVIRFDPDNLPGSLADIRIESASITTGDSGRDEQARGAEWFGSTEYPQIHFISREFTHLGEGQYSVQGSLTIRDVTKDISFPFTLDMQDQNTRMQAEILLNRLEYGVGSGAWQAVDVIGDQVKIIIDLSARRQ